MPRRERRTFKAEFKSKIALEAIKGLQSVAEIASKHKLHPNQIVQWKNQLIKDAEVIFDKNINIKEAESDDLVKKLYEEIGRLKMELSWFEKKF